MTNPICPAESFSSRRPVTIADWLNISHELRTPTNAILGHVELMISGAMGPLSSNIRASLGDIQRAGRDLDAQIAKAIDTGQDLSFSPPFPAETIALADQLENAWSKAQSPATTITLPSHQERHQKQPTCWLKIIALILQDLGATPSGNPVQPTALCDIDHTSSLELRFDLSNPDQTACSASVGIIKAAIGMTGGELKHLPGQLVLLWPTRKS